MAFAKDSYPLTRPLIRILITAPGPAAPLWLRLGAPQPPLSSLVVQVAVLFRNPYLSPIFPFRRAVYKALRRDKCRDARDLGAVFKVI